MTVSNQVRRGDKLEKTFISCSICDAEFEDDVECPNCGAVWCDGCQNFVPQDEWGNGEYCYECEREMEINRREAFYDMG